MSERGGPGELALPVPDDERPPGRRRRRGGSGVSILFIGALLVAGAWFGGKYARVLLHMGGTEPARDRRRHGRARRRARVAPPADQPAARETTRAGESARAREAARAKERRKAGRQAGRPKPGPKPRRHRVEAAKPAEAAAVDAAAARGRRRTPRRPPRHGSDTPPAREASPRRRTGDKPIDFVGRDIANLKDKMAPDPSLLPPPAPAEAPPPAPAPTAPPASPDNPDDRVERGLTGLALGFLLFRAAVSIEQTRGTDEREIHDDARESLETTARMVGLVLCGAVVGAAGCGKADDGEFNGSVPTSATVALEVPAASANTDRGGQRRGRVRAKAARCRDSSPAITC